MNVIERITSLRNLMRLEKIDAMLIYGTDPHLSEYVPSAWRSIEWISGFTGSYAKVVITRDKALLWTDSRYFIQAENQLKGNGFLIMKERQSDTIPIDQWLNLELSPGNTIAIDGQTVSHIEINNLGKHFNANGLNFLINKDLISQIWNNRPLMVNNPIVDYPLNFAGSSRSEKLSEIRKRLSDNHADATMICQLDDLAWSLNLRGSEINYIPCFTGYAFITHDQAFIFLNKVSISSKLTENLKTEGISVFDYESLFSVLEMNLPSTIFLDPDRTNSIIYSFYAQRSSIIDGISIPTQLKSIKNKVEISGMRAAHRRDGVAMVNFLYWFDKHSQSDQITEMSLAEKLRSFRSDQKYFIGESFSPIVGFGPHGAIVHYSATPETDATIKKDGILLIDSGGQYLDGTTDITRTISIGKVNSDQRCDFTLVLKGMINLAKAKFPAGTKGHSLDALARNALWSNGLNYGHGTGHGIGHYLSVHEGPMSIRSEYNHEPIREGQIMSNEPGLYRQDQYGIRIENVILCQNEKFSAFGPFLSFETLTLCPIDKKLIKRNLLNADELSWLNGYHKNVLRQLKPYLKPEVVKWLTIQCSSL